MYSHPLFDLIIFFGGAYASTGTITLTKSEKPTIEYDTKTLAQAAGISSVVPVYINEVPDIDQNFFDTEQPSELTLSKLLIDESIISNAPLNAPINLADPKLLKSLPPYVFPCRKLQKERSWRAAEEVALKCARNH